jgi:predicted GNAT family N-acyltransferase
MLYNYLTIRYKVFVVEFKRPIFDEFSKLDFCCKHHLLLFNNIAVGTLRLYYLDNIVELGRVALLADYRNKGYASLVISRLINQIKEKGNTDFIKLFTKNENIDFYKKFNFLEAGIRFFGDDPYPYMTMILDLK